MTSDATLGGYFATHERPPAFEGSDGEAYSVAIYVDDTPDPSGRFGASLLFVRWSADGTAPAGHVETARLVDGASPEEADAAIRRLSLHDVKEQLDLAIVRRRELPEW